MIPAILTILIAGTPMATIDGFVAPSACNQTLHLPRIENKDHQPVTARVDCEKP